MSSIQSYMTDHHKECDDLLADAEALIASQDWSGFGAAWSKFEKATLVHFEAEEEILFPAFEAKTGMTSGPTMVMRQEHSQVRAMFGQMAGAVENQDTERAIGIIESVMLLIQQHNMKEEQILYPMSDNHLDNSADVVAQMENRVTGSDV